MLKCCKLLNWICDLTSASLFIDSNRSFIDKSFFIYRFKEIVCWQKNFEIKYSNFSLSRRVSKLKMVFFFLFDDNWRWVFISFNCQKRTKKLKKEEEKSKYMWIVSNLVHAWNPWKVNVLIHLNFLLTNISNEVGSLLTNFIVLISCTKN
jgi:hypothetical protein